MRELSVILTRMLLQISFQLMRYYLSEILINILTVQKYFLKNILIV